MARIQIAELYKNTPENGAELTVSGWKQKLWIYGAVGRQRL